MPPNEVAIIGGGLAGLAVAISLRNHNIPFTIYESSPSFREIGAGLNIGPNASQAFRLIDATLGEEIERLCTRNPEGKEDVWMQMRFGAPAGKEEGRRYGDGALIGEVMAPVCNTTIHRNDLLQALASRAGNSTHAAFNKKLVSLSQSPECVTLSFSDTTTATASLVLACDGIHSTVRRCILPPTSPAAKPIYSDVGAYRAILPLPVLASAIGEEIARTSKIYLGPRGYVILYPIEHASKVNVGFWPRKPGGLWLKPDQWIVPGQKGAMEQDFADWGDTVKKIAALVEDPAFWPTYMHAVQPNSWAQGRVCLIGDAAHAMPPHQGAGSGQAMEDAYVMGEVLAAAYHQTPSGEGAEMGISLERVEAAFKGYESVRFSRAQKVLETSQEAFQFWESLYAEGPEDIDGQKVEAFMTKTRERFGWIWGVDLVDEARRAVEEMEKVLGAEA